MEKNIFILTENIDCCVTNVWYFHAKDKFEVARQIIDNIDYFDFHNMFNGRNWWSGIGRWRHVDDESELTVEDLLKAISDADPEKDYESGFQLYKIDTSKTIGVADEHTYTYDQQIEEYYKNKR